MRAKRRHERFTRRLEVEFSAHDKTYVGISSNFSIGGLFIRSNYPFPPETLITMKIHLPDGSLAHATGRVKSALKTAVTGMKNGMGVELVSYDNAYTEFIRTFQPEVMPHPAKETGEAAKPAAELPEFLIVTCTQCGVKNKIPRAKISWGIKCGKCRAPIEVVA